MWNLKIKGDIYKEGNERVVSMADVHRNKWGHGDLMIQSSNHVRWTSDKICV